MRSKRFCANMHYFCIIFVTYAFKASSSDTQHYSSVDENLDQLLKKCPVHSYNFDECIPEYNIKPFDPHYASLIQLHRGDVNNVTGINLILHNVTEYGWSQSKVTKYQTDIEQKRIRYSQYFPEKSLNGWYEFTGKIFGIVIKRKGFWNMTLYDYSQTTIVQRLGQPGSALKVNINIDNIGNLQMHVSNILPNGPNELNVLTDGIINHLWQLGLPFIKPIINELISTAFTDIFNKSFRYFPIEKFLKYS